MKFYQKVVCEDIKKFGNQHIDEIGTTGGISKQDIQTDKKNLKKLKKTRNSNVVWLQEPWISKHIQPIINFINHAAGWNFQIDSAETYQFTKYSKTQHYDWHTDAGPDVYDNGKTRKISMTINLEDGFNYEGGEFQIDHRNTNTGKKNIETLGASKTKGTAILFPSHIWHRVTPVTSGTRYSLVVWFIGPPFV